MYRPIEQYEAEPTPANPAALPRVLHRPDRTEAPTAAQYRALDLIPDLAEDIGTRRWFRGLGTMLALATLALAFWPDFSAVEAAAPLSDDRSFSAAFHAQAIGPLARGSRTGRRFDATSLVTTLASAPERPRIRMVTTLGEGDTFAGMMQRAGLAAGDVSQAASLISGAASVEAIAPGTRFDVTLGARPAAGLSRRLERIAFRARFDLDLSLQRQGSALVLERKPLGIDATPLRVQGLVGASLYRSARAAGAPAKAAQQYLQAIAARLDLESDLTPSDRFDIIVAFKRSAGGQSETGELLYAGLERAGKPIAQMMRWGQGGQFFDAAGLGAGEQQSAGFLAPVAGRMTSGFGMRRHPILGYSRMHSGIDFGAAWGAPIHAIGDGAVVYAGPHGGHGNYVRLDHGAGLGTGYAHMSRIAVAPGTHVHAGQVIGYVGSTGLSTGPHLHYELYQNGRAINPLGARLAVRAGVDEREQAEFKDRMAELKKVAPGAALQRLRGKVAFNGD